MDQRLGPSEGGPLIWQLFASSLLEKAGLDVANYNTHSFCIGAAASAKRQVYQIHKYRCWGRWKSGSFQQSILHQVKKKNLPSFLRNW